MICCIAGKNNIAVNALQYLLEEKKVAKENLVVITNQTDDGVDAWQQSLKFWAQKWGIKEVTLEDVYAIEDLIFLSLEFDKIIKPKRFKTKQLYNFHFSLLPKYKGMFTSILPIVNGEVESGVTFHEIDAGIDTGAIISQKSFAIDINDSGLDLYFKYLEHALELFKENIDAVLANSVKSTPQPIIGASYYSNKALDFSAIQIDYNKTAYEVHNQLRAFCFRTYQLPKFNDSFIYKTELTKGTSRLRAGRVIQETEAYYEISTIDYNLKLFKDYYQEFWTYCENGDLEGIKRIIGLIPDLNQRNKQGWNALIMACFNGHLEVVKYLCEQEIDIHTTNYKGTSCLMYAKSAAERSGNTAVMEFLLDCDVDINHKDNKDRTILNYAQTDNSQFIVDFLIEKGGQE